jgi:hypothetical protein
VSIGRNLGTVQRCYSDLTEVDVPTASLGELSGLLDSQRLSQTEPACLPARSVPMPPMASVRPASASATGDPRHCRPIGCYEAAHHLAHQYRRDR